MKQQMTAGQRLPHPDRELTEHLQVLLANREKQAISKLVVIGRIRGLLISYATEFDSKFKELIK